MTHARIASLAAILVLVFAVNSSSQTDYSSCSDSLDRLRRRASDASEAAQSAKQAQDELDSKKSDYDRCRRDPKTYDLYNDGCATRSRSVRSAQSDLDSAVSDLDSALGDVESAMRNVQSSCGSRRSPTTPITGVSPGNQQICTTVRRARDLAASTTLDLCKRYMPEGECKACLSAP